MNVNTWDDHRFGVGVLTLAGRVSLVIDGAGLQLHRHDPAPNHVVKVLAPVLSLAVVITKKGSV